MSYRTLTLAVVCMILSRWCRVEAAAFVRSFLKAPSPPSCHHHHHHHHCHYYFVSSRRFSSALYSTSSTTTSSFTTNNKTNFVVGYGSIMCEQSRAITCPDLISVPTIPIVVHNTERIWSKRSILGNMTAMGIQFRTGSSCTGILIPIANHEDLLRFDEREAGYERMKVPTTDIGRIPFLNNYDDDGDDLFDGQFFRDDHDDDSVNVWIYKPNELCFPSSEKPIVQSYLDTILRGCLDISEDFAMDFLKTTKGWSECETNVLVERGEDNTKQQHLLQQDHDDHHMVTKDQVHWINDRLDPIYSRGDQDWILKHADRIDDLLQTHREREYLHRVEK